MNIRVVENDAGFLSLKGAWARLAEDYVPFQKFDWVYRWWKYFKEDNNLKILVAEENNEIVGIAPLYIKNVQIFKHLTIKKVSFLAEDISLYLDFLIQQNKDRESCFQTLFNYILHNLSFDILELNDINSHFSNFDLWQKYVNSKNLNLTVFYKCPKIQLFKYKSYKDYFDQLSRKEKLSLKAAQNKIKKNNVIVEYLFKKDVKGEDIETAANIHIKRQQILYEKGQKGRFSHFTNELKANFIRDYFCFGETDSKMFVSMKCDGVVISYILVLLNKNTLFHWNSAFDSNYKMYTPTKLLSHELIKYAFENNYEYLDFGRGNDLYKLKWTDDLSLNYNLFLKKSFNGKFVCLCEKSMPEFLKPTKFKLKNIQTSLNSI